MKLHLQILIILSLIGVVIAAPKGKFIYTVTDKKTKEPLIFANVLLSNLEGKPITGSCVGHDGKGFMLNIEPGVYTAKITHPGYTELKMDSINIYPDSCTRLNLELEQIPYDPETILYIPPAYTELILDSVNIYPDSCTRLDIELDKTQLSPKDTIFPGRVLHIRGERKRDYLGYGHIAGKIFDIETGEDLIGAHIQVSDSVGFQANEGVTGIDGEFYLSEILPGIYNLRIMHVGYEDFLIDSFFVFPDSCIKIDFELVPTYREDIQPIIDP